MRIGVFPRPVWAAVIEWMSPPSIARDGARRQAILELRRAHPRLAALVAQCSGGGAGRIDLTDALLYTRFMGAATAPLGRALLVEACPGWKHVDSAETLVAALGEAIRRGHMLWIDYTSSFDGIPVALEPLLQEASRDGLLMVASVGAWPTPGLGELRVLTLTSAEVETVRSIVTAGRIEQLELDWMYDMADVSFLRGLSEVRLVKCSAVVDVEPLADVPRLAIEACLGIEALPPMRNDWLEVTHCPLRSLVGLAGGRVRSIKLRGLFVPDVSPIASMDPLPHSVTLWALSDVADVSMLAKVDRLTLIGMPHLEEEESRF